MAINIQFKAWEHEAEREYFAQGKYKNNMTHGMAF